ncbi:SCO4225 family membrane protein [Streptomyces sp. NBC_00162]|uniref:SCO4225 family membrane protein n=1 Tax=Streptomyces sp. NBC_00162 TaxID=2903629 RepID=UPI003A4C7383
MWVPGGYLALVVAMLVWVEVGDIGFGGIWPMLATAPVSLLLLVPFGPASDALHSAPVVEPHYGSQPPTPCPWSPPRSRHRSPPTGHRTRPWPHSPRCGPDSASTPRFWPVP